MKERAAKPYGWDECALVERLRMRDSAAFDALYARHYALVHGIASRVLGDRTQAEDITQNIFAQLWERPDSFRGGNFEAWIGRVARNACLDTLKSYEVRAREFEMPSNIPSDFALEDEVHLRVEADAILEALRDIPEGERQAIDLAFFQGLTYREVAARLGEPLGTVKSRLRAGLRRLSESRCDARHLETTRIV